MFKNYFKTAWRFLLKNKAFSFINIIGLAIGTLCCLYIVLYVKDQYSYDTQHNNAKDIYRIATLISMSGDKWLQAFAYRVNISWWMFALAGCIAICIALLTVSFQAIRAAVANPVKSLRTE